jgi:formylglycine-generating enzyme required for sulfatase activity
MAQIPAGSFTMGDAFSEGFANELPLHSVYISAFYMDKTEVTKAQWNEVYNWAVSQGYSFDYAGSGKAANHPVQSVSWYDCVKWCNARSEKEDKSPCYYTDAGQSTVYRTGKTNPAVNWNASGYRLPTEAEWEKAARGGLTGRRFPWNDLSIKHIYANYYSYKSYYSYDISKTHGYHPTFKHKPEPFSSPVGYFAANGYELYDMAGNVSEWCWDWYGYTYYASSPGSDPRGASSGTYRVLRGGDWNDLATDCRVAYRYSDPPGGTSYYIGFRCVRGL